MSKRIPACNCRATGFLGDLYRDLPHAESGYETGDQGTQRCDGRIPFRQHQTATQEQIEAVTPHVSSLVRDLIDVQRFSGARAGELWMLTPAKLDRSKAVWLFNVDGHKTEHHGHSRVIAIGANAQAVLLRRMAKLKPDDRVFRICRDSYTLAILRACVEFKIEAWTPHPLRHAMRHQVRDEFGLEHVQSVLIHSDFSMREKYAQVSLEKSIEVASQVG